MEDRGKAFPADRVADVDLAGRGDQRPVDVPRAELGRPGKRAQVGGVGRDPGGDLEPGPGPFGIGGRSPDQPPGLGLRLPGALPRGFDRPPGIPSDPGPAGR